MGLMYSLQQPGKVALHCYAHCEERRLSLIESGLPEVTNRVTEEVRFMPGISVDAFNSSFT